MAVELYVGLSNLWKHWHMKGANTQMRTGYVYAVRTCSVAVLWTSICCSIFNSQIIAWHSATGIHITISIIFFKLSSLFYYYYFFFKNFLHNVLQSCLGHVLITFGNSDLSVWCFSCDAYLDAQVIMQLRPVYETAYILKFGEAPPFRRV